MHIQLIPILAFVSALTICCSTSIATDDAKAPLPDFDKLWDYNDPAGTQMKFEQLLERAAASGDDTYYYGLQTQIARCPDGFVCEELAENLLLANDEPAAEQQFVKAWEKLKEVEWLRDGEPQRFERLSKYGSN